jgi:putative toxin-antitoxin system antitoxin component (TIGR02293 family)
MARAAQQRKVGGQDRISDGRRRVEEHFVTGDKLGVIGPFRFPSNRVEKLKERGFSNDELYKIVAPRRTLARRKELRQDLTVAESGRVMRLERISDLADRVFANHEKAQHWLRSEIIALDGARPIDLLATEIGAYEIEQELIRIDYGMLA